MTRPQRETFSQDRLGNVNRELDLIRGLDGMDASEDEDGIPRGLVEIEEENTDEYTLLMAIPEDASGFHLEEIHLHNSEAEGGSAYLASVTLDAEGDVDETTIRSTPLNVSGENTRTVSYSGREFSEDAIAVNAAFEGYVAIGGYMSRLEELEPAIEQEETPS